MTQKKFLDRVGSLINEDDLPVITAHYQRADPDGMGNFEYEIETYIKNNFPEWVYLPPAPKAFDAAIIRLNDDLAKHMQDQGYHGSHVICRADPDGIDITIDRGPGATGFVHIRLTLLRDIDGPFIVGGLS